MKETTVVVNTTKEGREWDRRSLIRELDGEVAELLGESLMELGADYCVTRTGEGKIVAAFYDTRPDADAWTAKITMTALRPLASVTIRYWNRIAGVMRPAEAKTIKKTANSAGIFEAKLPLEGADLLLLCED